MDDLHELLHLLSGRELEGEALTVCAAAVNAADDNENLDWVDDPIERRQIAVMGELSGWVAIGDKVDELHELISDGFQDPLPPYPYHDDKRDFPPSAYFRWLDDLLVQRGPGYELLLWDNSYDENLYALTVRRADMQRILDLSEAFGFTPSRALDAFPT